MENKIGIEVEYILRDEKGKVIMPPSSFDRDGFPVLGEIRAEPGENVVEVITNFEKARMEVVERLREGCTINFDPVTRIPLALYKKALAAIRDSDEEKDALLSTIMNVYNIDISDYSDQIIENNKIQGCRVSCGMHIHFSSVVEERREYGRDEYSPIDLKVGILQDKMEAVMHLYKKSSYTKEGVLKVSVSQLNRPTVEWIVKRMDEEFFERFAPAKKYRTKFRQAGFFEKKPYGFEYRSLAATPDSIAALPEIVKLAFKLLWGLNDFEYRSF
jgi:hypothetical protein